MIDISKTNLDILDRFYAYDIEVYPNYFCITFININKNDTIQFQVGFGIDDRNELIKFIKRKNQIYAGYNSLHYDNLVLGFILDHGHKQTPDKFCTSLFNLSKAIINEGTQNENVKKLKYKKLPFGSIDIFSIKPSNKSSVGLKQFAINLKWHLVQDLPIAFDKEINREESEKILKYNINDCLITKKAYFKLKSKIELRKDITALYGVDVINQTESGIASRILEALYSQKTGKPISEFRDLRTEYKELKVSDCINPIIHFQSEKMQTFLNELKSLTLHVDDDFKYKRVLELDGNTYDLGVGGIHTRDCPGIYESTENETIRDADVTSFYPYIIENFQLIPAHLGKDFSEIQSQITKDRVEYKELNRLTGDKEAGIRAGVLKIVANSIFGKLKDRYFWLYDPKAFMSVTLNGQMLLLMLAERFWLAGIKVISANTDGIVCRVRKDQEEVYKQICDSWMKDTKFTLEFTDYKLYIRRDVNNYFTLKSNGAIKEKGIFETEIDLFKGYSPKVIPKALIAYFVNGTPIADTIKSNTDIYDFMYSQKTGGGFKTIYSYRLSDGKLIQEVLQKNNRFYATKKGGYLTKIKEDQTTSLLAGQMVRVLNYIQNEDSFESYNVDFDWYINQAEDIRKIIDPDFEQETLF